jgi:hypothetical protein
MGTTDERLPTASAERKCSKMKITNSVRRTVAACGLGWALFDLFPGRHFNWMDWMISGLAVAIYVMSLFIKESNA